MLICKSCGAKNSDGRSFCRVCGEYFEEAKKRLSEEKPDKDELDRAMHSERTEVLHAMQSDLKSISEELRECSKYFEEVKKRLSEEKTDKDKLDRAIRSEQTEVLHAMQSDLKSISEGLKGLRGDLNRIEAENKKKEEPKFYRDFFGVHNSLAISSGVSPLSRWLALVLCALFGSIGLHRYYAGKIVSGVLYTLTCGAFGIGYLIDLILIACGKFTDKNGLYLKE